MAKSKTQTSAWTNTQVYVLGVICLLVGVAIGYFLHGSESSSTTQTSSAAETSAPAQNTPARLKQAVDTQAAPLLARLNSNPNDPQILAEVGNLYFDAQLYSDAIPYYERSLNANPKNVNVRTDMATSYFYIGNPDRALQELNTSLQEDPKHSQTLFNLGIVQYQGKKNNKAAIEAWQKLLSVDPSYPERARVEQLIAEAKAKS